MVTLDEADLVGSAFKTAVTVTVGGLGTISGAVNTPESLMVPIVGLPLCMAFTCQLTAELPAFCTVAVNATVVPAKGCADVGDNVMITGGGAEEEDTKPPQEFEAIAISKETTSRNESPECNARGGTAADGWQIKRILPPEQLIRKCRSNGWNIGSVRLFGIRGNGAKVTTTLNTRQGNMSRIMTGRLVSAAGARARRLALEFLEESSQPGHEAGLNRLAAIVDRSLRRRSCRHSGCN
jgi:hypothetical protein